MYCIFCEKIARWLTLQSHTTESIREKYIQYRLRRICSSHFRGGRIICMKRLWLALSTVHPLRHTSKDSYSHPQFTLPTSTMRQLITAPFWPFSRTSHNTQPFLNRRFCLNRLYSPPVLDPGVGTVDAPLIRLGTEDGIIHLILIKNGSAALSL